MAQRSVAEQVLERHPGGRLPPGEHETAVRLLRLGAHGGMVLRGVIGAMLLKSASAELAQQAAASAAMNPK